MQHVETNRLTVPTQTEGCDQAGMQNMLDPMSMSADGLILLEQSGSQSSLDQQRSARIKDGDGGTKSSAVNCKIILKCVLHIK